ncbi:hypothetical protein HMJ29_04890 [Hymenobacter taeanensis]|uniref:Uncharacterized protein n=1 Tax=Hymenobacter taeanensis TaxID=2735321 RepID=A0A6M6BEA3_9BACT|nr:MULTISPECIES: hypothetical protein [Hymenobacter]QJX46309.1 hypothetical protein HMJ29_04890 [Hymenobacter taeanensis]UOQ80166.1 hypothetical protein MUN83_15175 [Hymenobacter sp. 5414T-23]
MSDKQMEQGAEEWEAMLTHLRQVRQQVQEQGPLPEQEKAEAADAFRRGLAMLESQVQHIKDDQNGLKGSSGGW